MSFISRSINIFRVSESQFLNFRYYARWAHRRPKKVLTPEEYANIEDQYQDVSTSRKSIHAVGKISNLNALKEDEGDHLHSEKFQKLQWVPKNVRSETKAERSEKKLEQSTIDMLTLDEKSRVPIVKNDTQKKRKQTYKTMKDVESRPRDMLETVIDSDGNLVYTKLPNKDVGLSQALVAVKSRNEQIKKDIILLEGSRLIKEALEANCKLQSLIFSRKSDIETLKPFLPKSGSKIYKIPYREIQMWSDLSTTPGIMGIFKVPEVEKFTPPKDGLELTVVCDNVREPGNLGAILRTAVGVGVQSVFLTKGCVDLWDTKVLRSACGAHFRLQIHRKMDWNDINSHLENLKGSILIADNKITSDDIINNETSENLQDTISKLPLLPYYSINFAELGALVLIVGGETQGISGDAYRFTAEHSGLRLNIPLSNNVDSLNTGTSLGIILFEIKRQLAHFKFEDT